MANGRVGIIAYYIVFLTKIFCFINSASGEKSSSIKSLAAFTSSNPTVAIVSSRLNLFHSRSYSHSLKQISSSSSSYSRSIIIPKQSPFITERSSSSSSKKLMTLTTNESTTKNDDDDKSPFVVTTTTTTTTQPPPPPTITDKTLSLIGSTTSSLVAFTFFVVLSYQRNAYMISFFVGSICNGIISKILKRLLNQDRPSSPADLSSSVEEITTSKQQQHQRPSDKGMPSSHAMSLGFIGSFTALGIPSPVSFLGIGAYVLVSLYYRVKINLHTKEQVYVGLLMGVMNSIFWRSITLGTCPFLPNLNFMDAISTYILPESGILPVPFLVIPAIVGAAVVGSFERRIGRFVKKKMMKGKES